MKQSAARTLGVAVLGAAFAAVAAGSASAAALPVDAAGAIPAGTALDTMTTTLPTATEAAGDLLNKQNVGTDAAAPVAGLLGGMPSGALSTDGLSANGLPLGR